MSIRIRSIFSIVLAAALIAALAGCAASSPAAQQEDVPPAEAASAPDTVYTNGGIQFPVPARCVKLVTVDLPENAEDGTLISVYETLSAESAAADGFEGDNFGYLFGVKRVSPERLDELMTEDIPGQEVFARDAEGNAYLYCMPTDVTFYRPLDPDPGTDRGAQWEMLYAWAEALERDAILESNEGLTPDRRSHTDVDIYLARLARGEESGYTVSSLEFGPLEPDGVDAAPYLERLRSGAFFQLVNLLDTPDGEYYVLNLPDEQTRLDFFIGKRGYVRQVYGPNGELQLLYQVSYDDGSTDATEIMREWYDALATAQGLK